MLRSTTVEGILQNKSPAVLLRPLASILVHQIFDDLNSLGPVSLSCHIDVCVVAAEQLPMFRARSLFANAQKILATASQKQQERLAELTLPQTDREKSDR